MTSLVLNFTCTRDTELYFEYSIYFLDFRLTLAQITRFNAVYGFVAC